MDAHRDCKTTANKEVHPEILNYLSEEEQKLILAVIETRWEVAVSIQNAYNDLLTTRFAFSALSKAAHVAKSMHLWESLVNELKNRNADSRLTVTKAGEETISSLHLIEDELVRIANSRHRQQDSKKDE